MAFLTDSRSYLSPLVGYGAKNSDLLYNLRFFGNCIPKYVNGIRSYADDIGQDRMWAVVRILFPSPAGALTTLSSAAGCFGKNITDSQPVSALLALATYLRALQYEVTALSEIATEQFKCRDTENGKKTRRSMSLRFPVMRLRHETFAAMFPWEEYKQLCNHVYELITNPEANLIKLGYPEFLLEQVLIGFIMAHFNNSQEYVNDLPRDFFTMRSHPIISQVREYVHFLENRMYPTAFGKFPHTAINSGVAKVYDRTNNQILEITHADCCETATRHLCTLLLWDMKAQTMRSCVNEAINDFYAKYAPNDGSTDARSAWNVVVGDLNVDIGNRPRISYETKAPRQHDLDGFIPNFALILMRIFQLETPEFIKKYVELEKNFNAPECEELMAAIFNAITPNTYACKFKTKSLYPNQDNMSWKGQGMLQVKYTVGSELVTFTLHGYGHGEVSGIKYEYRKRIEIDDLDGDGDDDGDEEDEEDEEDGGDDEEDERGENKTVFGKGDILPEEIPSSFQVFGAFGFPVRQDSFHCRMTLNLKNDIGFTDYLRAVLHYAKRNPTPGECQSFRNVISAYNWQGALIVTMSDTVRRLHQAGLHVSDMKGKVDSMTIHNIEDFVTMEILGACRIAHANPIDTLAVIACMGNLHEESFTVERGGWKITIVQDPNRNKIVHPVPVAHATDVVVPKHVEDIGTSLFANAIKLKRLVLHDNISSLGETFLMHSPITEFTIPKGVAKLEDQFMDYSSVVSMTVPRSIKHVGRWFMYGCKHLMTVIIDAELDSISDNFLSECPSLKHVELPDTVRSVGQNFLRSCACIESIRLPPFLETIGAFFMNQCDSLEEIHIPNTVVRIGANFMNGCEQLEKVELSDGITDISVSFLNKCPLLKRIRLPPNLKKLNLDFMRNCPSLTEIIWPPGLNDIDNNVFCDCIAIEKLELPISVNTVGNFFAWGCSSLRLVGAPGITSVGSDFLMRSGIENFEMPTSLVQVEDRAFSQCPRLRTIKMSPNLNRAGIDFAYMCESLLELNIPASLAIIPNNFLQKCASLKSVTISDGIREIGTGFARGCKKLRSLVVPKTVTLIGDVFATDCTRLENLEIKNVKRLGELFAARTNLREFSIPSTVTYIGGWFLSGCHNLEKLSINGPILIKDDFLVECERLTEVSLRGVNDKRVKLIDRHGKEYKYSKGTVLTRSNVKIVNGTFSETIRYMFSNSSVETSN